MRPTLTRLSKSLLPSLREAPKDAQLPSHALSLRAGLIRQVGAGLYELLPMGRMVLRRIEAIVREELDAEGAQEILMPGVLPAEYLRESGRWESFGDALCRFKDRKGADLALAPTHEEIVTDIARRELRSYRQLPAMLYQVQTKFRDEPRPRGGLLRGREFIMKDAYSFDVDEAAALQSYERMRKAYTRIFTRLGLDFRIVEADSGAMGGSRSAEFQILAKSGEDKLVTCGACAYAANAEVATSGPVERSAASVSEPVPALRRVATPGVTDMPSAIAALGDGHALDNALKTLVVEHQGEPVAVVVRGDHELNLMKLSGVLGATVTLASREKVQAFVGAPAGSIGPVNFPGRVVVDREAAALAQASCGANETEVHLVNVVFGRDYVGETVDIRMVEAGDPCPRCGAELSEHRGIEGGHIFVLGTHYSKKMSAHFTGERGEELPFVMGCYGIGMTRLIAAIIEQHHDTAGIRWPASVAPFDVVLVPISKRADADEIVAMLSDALRQEGLSVLIDDRNERPGVKFKDAELFGIPLRVTLGDRGLEAGKAEVTARHSGEAASVALADAAAYLKRMHLDLMRGID